jgi:hypothetical protein
VRGVISIAVLHDTAPQVSEVIDTSDVVDPYLYPYLINTLPQLLLSFHFNPVPKKIWKYLQRLCFSRSNKCIFLPKMIENKIIIDHLAYVHYEHKDLKTFSKFAKDFGLVESPASDDSDIFYFHGYGKDPITYIASHSNVNTEPNFRGPGFVVRTKEDFDKACKLPGAVIQKTSNRPSGGELVLVPDPNGFHVEIVLG